MNIETVGVVENFFRGPEYGDVVGVLGSKDVIGIGDCRKVRLG